MISAKERLNIFVSYQHVWRFTGTYYYYVVLPVGFTYLRRNYGQKTTFASDDLFSSFSKMPLTKNSKSLHLSYN